jgi:hypothetical protein
MAWVIAFWAGSGVAQAGPWTPARGHGQVIVGWTFYETHDEFTKGRDRVPFEWAGRFRKVEVNPYFETGLTDRVALVGSLFASQQDFTNSWGQLDNAGLGDTELGLRYRLTGPRALTVMAVQGSVKVPTGRTSGGIALTNGQTDVQGTFSIGGSIGRGERPAFWSVDAGYRYRARSPADEVRVDAALGAYVHRRVQLLAQASTITGLRNEGSHGPAFNPTLTPDYDLYRVTGSAIVRVASHLKAQAGGFVHAWGRNTGAGAGALASISVEY